MLLGGRLEHFLESCKEDIEELLGVLLDGGVRGVAIEVFEGETETKGVEGLALRELKVRKHDLKLAEEVVVDEVTSIFF